MTENIISYRDTLTVSIEGVNPDNIRAKARVQISDYFGCSIEDIFVSGFNAKPREHDLSGKVVRYHANVTGWVAGSGETTLVD